MKKFLFTTILLAATVCSNTFAKHIGDLQLRAPGFSSNKAEGASERTNTINFGIATYQNWFVVPEIVGVGFVIESDIGSKNENKDITTGVNALIGPAVSVTLGKVVRLELGMGLNIGYSYSSYRSEFSVLGYSNKTETKTNLFGVGFGIDFAAVFLPKARFSPLVGLNFSTFSGHGKAKTHVYASSGSAINPTYPDIDVDLKSNSFKMFIGGCFNFGNK